MTGFPVFTPQPTPVNVSLFGDAARAGASLASAIPSTATAIVSGAQQGFKFGTDIQQQRAQIAATNQATENAQTQGEINKLDLEVRTELKGEVLEAEKARLEAARQKLTQQNSLGKATEDFFKTFQAASPLQQKQMVLGGQNAALFAQNPELFEASLQQLRFNPTTTSAESLQIAKILKDKQIDDTFAKQAEQAYPKYLESQQELLYGKGADTTNTIANALKVAPEQVPYAGEWVPAGLYTKDPDTGKVVLDPSTGQRKRNAIDYKLNPELKDRYTFISNQPNTNGLVVAEDVDVEQRNIQEKFKTQTALQTGLQARHAKQFIQDNSGQQQRQDQKTAKTEVGTFGNPTGNAQTVGQEVQAVRPGFTGFIQKELKLSEPETQAIEAPASQLKIQMEAYLKNPSIRNDISTKMNFTRTIGTMARSITDTQFKNSTTLQSQYTPSHVVQYNESLNNIVKSESFSWLPETALANLSSIMNAFKVESPEDLYYVNQGPAINSSLSRMVNGFMSQVNARSSNAANNAAAIQSRNSYLQGVSNGGATGQQR